MTPLRHVKITGRAGGKVIYEAELLPVMLREGVRFVAVEHGREIRLLCADLPEALARSQAGDM